MNRAIILILLLLSIMHYTAAQGPSILEAKWKFKGVDTLDWMPATVPGCVHTDLEKNTIIPNPLIGINEQLCQWIPEHDWVYETAPFDVSDSIFSKENIRLKFHQLDTYATVYLNDQKILVAENAFRSYEVDVKSILKNSGNVLRIQFTSPTREGTERLKALDYPIPGDAMRAITRKPQYHYGWDWGPKLITSGITGPIEWIAYNEIHIRQLFAEQKFISAERAELVMHVDIHSTIKEKIHFTIHIPETGETISTEAEVRPGLQTLYFSISIKQPKLWWSNGLGEPNLYHFDVTLEKEKIIVARASMRTGLRTIKLITEKDEWGESFYFELNGKPVFAKGANYIPITMLPAIADTTTYRQLLAQAKDAHFNMLRVWGGGYYEPNIFYSLCDEMGIMVWQDFMFACSMYPGNERFLINVKGEAEEQVQRLRNHACIALWCGNNENAEGWQRWGWQIGLTKKDKEKLEKAYSAVFNHILPEAVFNHHAQINYWESSPRYGRGDSRSFTEGDSHYWGLWHDEEPFELLNKRVPRFMSEFGMQSYPNAASLQEIITLEPLADNAGMNQHQKHPRGKKLMDDYMRRWYTTDFIEKLDIESYGILTQSVQAEGMMMGIEAHRRNQPYCMGTLFWQLNDVWPAFSWSAIDYKMQPKLFMQALQIAYAPMLVSSVLEDEFLHIYFINDSVPIQDIAHLEIEIEDAITGIKINDRKEFISIAETGIIYSKKWNELAPNESPEDKFITMTLVSISGQSISSRTTKIVGKTQLGIHISHIENGEIKYKF